MVAIVTALNISPACAVSESTLSFCVGVKLGLVFWGRNIDCDEVSDSHGHEYEDDPGDGGSKLVWNVSETETTL
jgi:hypothetical protein